MSKILGFLLSIFLLGCYEKDLPKVNGAFMNMYATESPMLLAPELLAGPFDEYNGTFSPDGTEFFYTTNPPDKGLISYTYLNENKNWEEPSVAFFSGNFSEYDPIFSPDGKRLYFTSTRPSRTNSEAGKTNIWYIEKVDDQWSDPVLLDLGRSGVYYSSLTRNGDIYFNIWSDGEIYKGVSNNDGYAVMKLDTVINSNIGEGDPFVSPDEDYLIFRGYVNTLGQGDLYISFNIDGQWTKPENLGEPINSSAHEMCPYITSDGKYFIFASARINSEYTSEPEMKISDLNDQMNPYDNGNLNIYYMSADFIPEMRKKYE